MVRIVFICLGNICRSPLAQGIFEDEIKKLGLEDSFYVDSAGTSSWHQGEAPDRGSVKIARENDINIESQKSRPVTSGDRHEFDYFIAMDESNYRSLVEVFGIPKNMIFKIRDFDPEPDSRNVPDPYGGGSDNFALVFNILKRSTPPLIDFLRKKHHI